MRSTFYGLGISVSGLLTSQKQLDVTAHNIANVDTPGYSRQRYILEAVPPPGYNPQFAPIDKGQSGQGVQTLSLDQIRDIFLDRQFRQENPQSSYWSNRADAMYYIEDVFNGDPSTSLSGLLGTFFNAVQELSKNPTDEAIRTNLTQETKKMTEVFHTYYSQLKDLMYQQDYTINAQVGVINEFSSQIASLNDSIFRFEQGGQIANDLRDQRNLLLDKLSQLTDISYQEVGTGYYDINRKEITKLEVYIGADKQMLVDHTTYRTLKAEQDVSNDVTDAYVNQPVSAELLMRSIRFDEEWDAVTRQHSAFAESGDEINISTGALKSLLDVRDGNTKDNQGIPYFIAKLDTMAKALVETFNDIHMQGWTVPYTDLNGVYHPSQTGIPYFDVTGLTAGTIRLSDEVVSSGFNIAASDEEVTKDPVTGHFNTGNNIIALELIKGVKERNDVPIIGSFEGFFKSFLSELASEVSHSNQMADSHASLAASLNDQRQSIMGVSMDEEMVDMVRFQNAYNASARMITTMDDMLEMLIMRTGRVGL